MQFVKLCFIYLMNIKECCHNGIDENVLLDIGM